MCMLYDVSVVNLSTCSRHSQPTNETQWAISIHIQVYQVVRARIMTSHLSVPLPCFEKIIPSHCHSELRPICAICREIVMLSSVVSDWLIPSATRQFLIWTVPFVKPLLNILLPLRVTIWALAKTDRFGHSFVLTIQFIGGPFFWPTTKSWAILEAPV